MVCNNTIIAFLATGFTLFNGVAAFSTSKLSKARMERTLLAQTTNQQCEGECVTSRRNAISSGSAFVVASLFTAATASAPPAALAEDKAEWTPFNGLIYNYRASDSNTGLDASTLTEPSVPFQEFLDKLSADQVSFVEFMAPNGDAAYATFKGTVGEDGVATAQKPIRIGQGYPTEDPEGWSSPSFVMRCVENKKVPYKFTVPALAAYR